MDIERKEALLRIPIGILCWIIVELWGLLATVLVIFMFFHTIFTGKRHKGMANFVNQFICYFYHTLRYISFTTNQRPFPFNDLGKPFDKISLKSSQEK